VTVTRQDKAWARIDRAKSEATPTAHVGGVSAALACMRLALMQ
jgi:hypothetical protein